MYGEIERWLAWTEYAVPYMNGVWYMNAEWSMVFFFLSKHYNVQTNNLQSTKINENNMIKMSQTINITLQPIQ